MYITDRTHVSAVRTTFHTLGIDPPTKLAAAFDRADTIATRFNERPLSDNDTIAAAIATALEAGIDPASDPEVQRQVTAQLITERVPEARTIEAHATGIAAQAITTGEAAILKTWRTAFDQAAATLADAHKATRGADLDDAAAILRMGPDAAAAWATAPPAAKTITTIANGWSALAQLAGFRTIPNRALIIADLDPATILDNRNDLGHRANPTPWQLLAIGARLRLPTIAEYRTATRATDHLAADRQAEAEARAEHHRQAGPTAGRLTVHP